MLAWLLPTMAEHGFPCEIQTDFQHRRGKVCYNRRSRQYPAAMEPKHLRHELLQAADLSLDRQGFRFPGRRILELSLTGRSFP